MPVSPPPPPDAPPLTRAERERADRIAREAQALRDNLRRRKQQSRARQEEAAPETKVEPSPSGPSDDC